jgi:hypothetical protein
MDATMILTQPGQRFVDCATLGHPLSWYQAVRSAGYVGVALDVASGDIRPDVEAAWASGLWVTLFQGYDAGAWADLSQARARAEMARQALLSVGHLPGAPVVCWLDSEEWLTLPVDHMRAWVTAWLTTVGQDSLVQPGLYVGEPQPAGATPADCQFDIRWWGEVPQWQGSPSSPCTAPAAVQEDHNVGWSGVIIDTNVVRRPFAAWGPVVPPSDVRLSRTAIQAVVHTLQSWLQ